MEAMQFVHVVSWGTTNKELCNTQQRGGRVKTMGNSVISTLLVNKKSTTPPQKKQKTCLCISDIPSNFQRQSLGQKASKWQVSQFKTESVQLDFNVIYQNSAHKMLFTPSFMVTEWTYLLLHPTDTGDLWPFCHSPQPPRYCQQQPVAFSPGLQRQQILLWTNWNFEEELF